MQRFNHENYLNQHGWASDCHRSAPSPDPTLGPRPGHGALVELVVPGSPADAAGILGGDTIRTSSRGNRGFGGDVVVGINGAAVLTPEDLIKTLGRTRPWKDRGASYTQERHLAHAEGEARRQCPFPPELKRNSRKRQTESEFTLHLPASPLRHAAGMTHEASGTAPGAARGAACWRSAERGALPAPPAGSRRSSPGSGAKPALSEAERLLVATPLSDWAKDPERFTALRLVCELVGPLWPALISGTMTRQHIRGNDGDQDSQGSYRATRERPASLAVNGG